MQKMRFVRVFDYVVGNRKSKIQNAKLVGIFAVIITFAICGAVAEGQQPKKVPRIGYLSLRSQIETGEAAFQKGLRELGYTEGHNIQIDWQRATENQID